MDKMKELKHQMEVLENGLAVLLKDNNTSLLGGSLKNMECVLSNFSKWAMAEIEKQKMSIPKRTSIKDEITHSLRDAIDFGKILVLHEKIYITSYRKGNFEDITSEYNWKEFTYLVNSRGSNFLAEQLSDGRSVFDENEKVRVMFDTPIRIITGFEWANGKKEYSISEVTGIIILLDYEWYISEGKSMNSVLEVTGTIIGLK